MEQGERADNGPSVDKLAVGAEVAASSDTMGTTANPVAYIFTNFGPEEPSVQSMECLLFTQMASSWRGMVCAEHIQSERCWDHNHHERLTVIQGVEEGGGRPSDPGGL